MEYSRASHAPQYQNWMIVMPKSIAKKLIFTSFWLSLFLHLLLIVCFSTILWFKTEDKKKPTDYVPAYMYKGSITPSPPLQRKQPTLVKNQSITQTDKQLDTDNKQGIIYHSQKTATVAKNNATKKSLLLDSFEMLKEDQLKTISDSLNTSEPIYLIGDPNESPDPLIKLMGRALSANFRYPRMAEAFGIRGKVFVGFTIHPEGQFTGAHILQSSNNDDLDAAALRAVNTAPVVEGVNKFLSKPKYFVVGFVFR